MYSVLMFVTGISAECIIHVNLPVPSILSLKRFCYTLRLSTTILPFTIGAAILTYLQYRHPRVLRALCNALCGVACLAMVGYLITVIRW